MVCSCADDLNGKACWDRRRGDEHEHVASNDDSGVVSLFSLIPYN